MQKFLVTYATKYGSTREVAEAIATAMRESGAAVDVRPCTDVRNLDAYDGLVVGSPLYIGSMLKDARRFFEANRATIQSLPTALFLLGPLKEDDDMDEARKQFDHVLEKLPWFSPLETEMFVGAYDPQRLRALDKLAALPPASPLHGVEAHDDRDWSAIAEWGGQIARRLMSAAS